MKQKVLSSVVGVVALLLFSVTVQATHLPDFTEIVSDNAAAVVNISTTQKVTRERFPGMRSPHMPEGTPFDDFFQRFFDGEKGPPRDYSARSLGSGFIISADGYILTNNHVVKDADQIIVRLSDRRELEAELIGTDVRSDVAVLKVDAEGLPVVKIGDPEKLKVGEWVLAIGSPFDFDHSVTAGIVSAVGRSLPNENYVPFIQTDVAINPGNSGGPLFNLEGEVIGVNAQIYSRTGGFMGLSFSIPIDLAMNVVEQLKSNGHVTRGWLGVMIQDVTRELAESFGMDKPGGALVSQVMVDSPAAKAGFQVGDVIVEFNRHEVPSSSALPPMVGTTQVDESVKVKVIRNGKTKRLTVVIGALPSDGDIQPSRKTDEASDSRLNIEIVDLDAEQRKLLEIETYGIIIKKVDAGPALDAGIREGDILMMINSKNVESVAHFTELLDSLPAGKSVAVLVQRRSGPVFLALKLPENSD